MVKVAVLVVANIVVLIAVLTHGNRRWPKWIDIVAALFATAAVGLGIAWATRDYRDIQRSHLVVLAVASALVALVATAAAVMQRPRR